MRIADRDERRVWAAVVSLIEFSILLIVYQCRSSRVPPTSAARVRIYRIGDYSGSSFDPITMRSKLIPVGFSSSPNSSKPPPVGGSLSAIKKGRIG